MSELNYARPQRFVIKNTKFIWRTNFSGDPSRDPKYGSEVRRGNFIIPSDVAEQMREYGLNVKETQPRAGEEEGFEPRYYVAAVLNYKSDVAKRVPPKVYLVSGDSVQLLDEETVGILDHVYVLNVDVTLQMSISKRLNKPLLYIKTMYVTQEVDDDPFHDDYFSAEGTGISADSSDIGEEVLPFD